MTHHLGGIEAALALDAARARSLGIDDGAGRPDRERAALAVGLGQGVGQTLEHAGLR